MPSAKCMVRCWDGDIGRLYYPGDIVDGMPLNHKLAKCFRFEKEKPKEPDFSSSDEPETKEEKRGPGRPKGT